MKLYYFPSDTKAAFLGFEDDFEFERFQKVFNAFNENKIAVLPCKPGDDIYWYNDDENKVECQQNGIKGVVVLQDGFELLDTDGVIDAIGTQYACLTAEECQQKYGAKPQNKHYMNRFMEVK